MSDAAKILLIFMVMIFTIAFSYEISIQARHEDNLKLKIACVENKIPLNDCK